MALCQATDDVLVTCDGDCDCEVVMDIEDVRVARRFAQGVRCECCR